MKRPSIDWRYMRKSIISVTTSIGICAVLFFISTNYYRDAQRHYAAQHSSYAEIQERYNAALEDVRLLQTFHDPYQILVKQGLIGDEHRLYWVETVRKIAEDLKIKKVTYRIDPQIIYTADFLTDLDDIGVFASRMTLQLDLLHEGDLLYLIDSLNSRVPGSFHVNQCSLRRTQDKFGMHPSNTNLFADCEFTWFTIKNTTNLAENTT